MEMIVFVILMVQEIYYESNHFHRSNEFTSRILIQDSMMHCIVFYCIHINERGQVENGAF
jgi:hypothetical protein